MAQKVSVTSMVTGAAMAVEMAADGLGAAFTAFAWADAFQLSWRAKVRHADADPAIAGFAISK